MSVPTPHAELLSRIPIREHEVTVLGSTTRYWDYGPLDARHTVVIAHGYRGDHHGLEPVIARLPGIRFIGPDLPGFGASTPLTEVPHTIEGYGRWLGGFIEALGLSEPPVLLGHSFGSIIGSHAVADGVPVRGLILLNPISTDPKVGAGVGITRLTRAFYATSRAMPKGVARAWLGNWLVVQFMSMSLVTTDDKTLEKWIHEEHHRFFNDFQDPRVVADGFTASISNEVGNAAERITVPTVLIAGEVDRITPLDGQHRTVELFPDAKLIVIDGIGHLLHYEAPDATAAAITAFLDELPA